MVLKRLISSAGFLVAMGLSTQVVMASSGFEIILNNNLQNGASVSCNACHVNGNGSASTASLPMAVTYKSARSAGNYALVASSDSDGDGFTNAQEVNAAAVNFNDKTITPFTLVTGQAFTGTNVIALADAGASEAPFTDTTPLAVTGKIILGGIKVTLNQTDTIYFKAGGVDTTSSVYVVDAAGGGTVLAPTVDWVANADGSLKINSLPAGSAFPAALVVVRSALVSAPPFAGNASVFGCITGSLTMPLLLLFTMFTLGLFIRRK